MKIKRFKAPDMRQAIKMVREEHGADAVILSNRKVDDGIEIISAIDYDESYIETMLEKEKSGSENNFEEQVAQESSANANLQEVGDFNYEQVQSRQQVGQQNPIAAAIQNQKPVQNNSGIVTPPYLRSNQPPQYVLPQEYQQAIPVDQNIVSPAQNSNSAGQLLPQQTQGGLLPTPDQYQNQTPSVANVNTVHGSVNQNNQTAYVSPEEAVSNSQGRNNAAEDAAIKSEPPVSHRANESIKAFQGSSVSESSLKKQDTGVKNSSGNSEEPRVPNEQYMFQEKRSQERDLEVMAMKRELDTLKGLLNTQIKQPQQMGISHIHPAHTGIYARLHELGIGSDISHEILSQMPLSSDVNEGWRKALAILAHKVKVSESDIIETGGVVVLVGPTGVGKTTSIAKLAARYALKHGRDQVVLVSMDNYRVASQDQILTYGKMLGTPVYMPSDVESFKTTISDLYDKPLILIDTPGIGQRDKRMKEQFDLLKSVPFKMKTFLVLSSNTQNQALNQIASAYSDLDISGSIITKIDEAASLGGLLSTLIKWQIPIGYISEGQKVPDDLAKARPYSLVSKAVTMMQQTELLSASSSYSVNGREDNLNAHA